LNREKREVLNIEDKALFIADSHVNKNRDELYAFLELIEKDRVRVSQIFFMGDIFDLLVGGIKFTINYNKKYIDLINKISLKKKIFYFEGNHDFNLTHIFPNIKIFSFEQQPVVFNFQGKKVLLSHGDILTSLSYKIYTKIIRSSTALFLLNLTDSLINNYISKKIINIQKEKIICNEIKNFNNLIYKRMDKINIKNIDYIVEGHFHQNKKIKYLNTIYINLPSFACNKSFFTVQSQNGFKEAEVQDIKS